MKRLFSVSAAALIALSGCAGEENAQITNFDECVAAGNPVMESYPRQCRAGGQTFVEEINPQ